MLRLLPLLYSVYLTPQTVPSCPCCSVAPLGAIAAAQQPLAEGLNECVSECVVGTWRRRRTVTAVKLLYEPNYLTPGFLTL